ncbi:hypothetical protein JJC03_04220 [Flavobacterium oreochromis]|uniref:hypothetical protein n=1 Tax=Flavobacterium oreochromis TaxID=2906078 RepID=UPI001CE5890C|nr:hypothetical protein [Flavobacterium oreochromis]QYS87162.1 hypothetical protein JJC03_04220 [Flavobacterium oreochromis]
MKFKHLLILLFHSITSLSQTYIEGTLTTENIFLSFTKISINEKQIIETNSEGYFKSPILEKGNYKIEITKKSIKNLKQTLQLAIAYL